MARKQVKSVSGKVVAITGGARGIGDATANALAAAGARVAIGDLDADLAAQSAQAYGGRPRHAQHRVLPPPTHHRAARGHRHEQHRLTGRAERGEQVAHHVAEHPAERGGEREHRVLLVRVDQRLQQAVVRAAGEREG